MLILGISTSSNIASVAISKDAECIKELNINNNKTHSETLVPLINELLKKTNIKLQDINLLACDNGPGSFTGIRIGISTVKAIAESLNIPVIAVSSLEGLAYNINQTECICSLVDARNNQVYCGIFDSNHNLLQDYMADDINNVLQSINQKQDITFVGDGAITHKDLLNISDFKSDNLLHAKNINLCAFNKFNKGKILNADSILPMYLRKSQAERMRNLNE
ncbi:MAG: tRNA (adenosine(37)-N6)-threonylcarbamoyltransferase complex dimerization subunit type 1 TsaB [Clostridia bacterium]